MSKDIYVIAEQRDGVIAKVTFELIGKATQLAGHLQQKVVAVLLGSQVAQQARALVVAGADEVVLVDDPMLQEYVTEPYAKALTQIIRECDPEIVLFGATSIGRDLAPRIAARVRTGLTADCTGLAIDVYQKDAEDAGQKLLFMTRPAFGGNIMATILCKTARPQMATVRPGVMKALTPDDSRTGTVREIKVPFVAADMNVKLLEVQREHGKQVDITEAKTLISGGRGIGSAEFFSVLQELAKLLGGEISSSRANVDAGWIGRERQVGQTGKTVRPQLYMACGISGAIQHVAGMENSECVISINKNDTAAIFDVSDLGIVGDVKVILPKLIDALRKRKGV